MSSLKAGALPQVTVTFASMQMPAQAHWEVRADVSDGEDAFTFPPTALKGGAPGVSAKVTADKPLPDMIINAEMDISWQVSFDGGKTWSSAGSTDNHLYMTGGNDDGKYETVIAIGCMAAAGDVPGTDDSDIVSRIFGAFSSLDVRHVANGVQVGNAMTYWGPQASGAAGAGNPPQYFTTAGLLQNSDGRCDAWAHFFSDCAAAQGIKGVKLLYIRPNYQAPYPHVVGEQPGLPPGGQRLVVNPGAAAQGNTTPTNVFNAHVVTLWTAAPGSDVLYDPSYGTQFAGTGADPGVAVGIPWEEGSLSKIRILYSGGAFRDVDLRPPGQNNNQPNCKFGSS